MEHLHLVPGQLLDYLDGVRQGNQGVAWAQGGDVPRQDGVLLIEMSLRFSQI